MTTLTHSSALHGPANGGVAARRALVRWAWRMFRREWRQQILVVALLTVAVAAAIASITLVYNTGPAYDSEFGSASGLLRFDGSDPQALEAALASAEESFGTTDVIGHRKVPVPGGVETVDFRSQDPDEPYGGDLLALRRGSYPTELRQVALTDGVATLLDVELGATLDLDGRRRTVVGIVENPLDLRDEFALVSPSSAAAAPERHRSGQRERTGAPRLRRLLAQGRPFGPYGAGEPRQDRGRRLVGNVLGRHRLPAPGLARCRRGLRCRRAASAPPARHARGNRGYSEACPPRAADQRRRRRS